MDLIVGNYYQSLDWFYEDAKIIEILPDDFIYVKHLNSGEYMKFNSIMFSIYYKPHPYKNTPLWRAMYG